MVAADIGALDAKLGQFFTPYDVARCIAEMTLGDVDKLIAEQGYVTIGEPAAGAGGMIIAAAECIKSRGHKPATTMSVEATELSRRTFHMCYVQLALCGIPALMVHGNSLSLDQHEASWTPAAQEFLSRHGHLFPDRESAVVRDESQNTITKSCATNGWNNETAQSGPQTELHEPFTAPADAASIAQSP